MDVDGHVLIENFPEKFLIPLLITVVLVRTRGCQKSLSNSPAIHNIVLTSPTQKEQTKTLHISDHVKITHTCEEYYTYSQHTLL